MPSDFDTLTPAQQQVLTLLATGSTATAAAEQAGVHRNTIANWRRSSPAFVREFHALHYERAIYWREGMQAIAEAALEELRYTMVSTNSPPSVRVRAALAILNTVMTVPPPPPDLPPDNVIAMPPPLEEPAPSPQEQLDPQPAPYLEPDRKSAKLAQLCTNPKPFRTLAPSGLSPKRGTISSLLHTALRFGVLFKDPAKLQQLNSQHLRRSFA